MPQSENVQPADDLPLRDLAVVEMAGIGPSSFAGTMLAEMGARVLRIERPGGVDSILPAHLDRGRTLKESVALDMKAQAGREAFLDLVERADVLIEGYRPGVMEQLSIGPAECARRNPRLVFARFTGWGQSGPLAPRAAHDVNFISISGALHAIGERGRPPVVPLTLVGDFGGGALYGLTGILAALHDVSQSGEGRVIDAAIVDGSAHLMGGVFAALSAGIWNDERSSNLWDGGNPSYAVYETADGRYMSVSAVEDKFFAAFAERIGLEVAVDRRDPANWPELKEQIADIFRTRTRQDWEEVFAEVDACVFPVLSLAEVGEHPHVQQREIFQEEAGVTRVAPAPRFSRLDQS